MNVKKAVKRVAALGAATAMVGATLFGAVAQTYTLGDYPQPFVMDGVFDPAQAVIVVGEKAATSDVLGAIELAASLQAEAVTLTPVEISGTVDPTVTSGVKIARSGEDLNYGEYLADIDSKLTDSDLPDLLADGTFDDSEGNTDNEVDFDQEVEFGATSGQLVFEQDDETEITGSYLKMPKNVDFYTYSFDFDSDTVSFDEDAVNDDFEGVTFEIQGNQYTITGARVDSDDNIDRLKLLVGDVVRWVAQDAPINVGDHTITVVSVDTDGTKCGVEVDGDTKWLNVGETKTVGGLEVGVLDAIAVHSELADQDTCELSLGSQELILEDNQEVTVNGEDVDGSEVTFRNASGNEWDGFEITWAPEDDMWLSSGDAWTDPVLSNWKMIFEGVTAETEMVTVTSGASDGMLTFVNIDGTEVEVPFVEMNDTVVMYGDDEDYFGYLGAEAGQIAWTDADVCDPGADLADCEGIYFMAVSSGNEARLMEVDDIDESDNKITLRDLSTSKTYTETYVSGSSVFVDVGFTEVELVVDETADTLTFADIGSANDIETELGAVLGFAEDVTSGVGTLDMTLTEDAAADPAGIELSWEISMNDDEEVIIDFDENDADLYEEEDGSDDEIGTTSYGTLIRWDAENQDKLEFTYPEEPVYANVFITPINADVIASGGAGSVNAEKVNKIPVGMSVLDVNAESMTKHMIVVGGPCANTIADEVTGDKESCVEGFEEGRAKIAVYTRRGKTALLVAGYTAQDTLAAAYVLADYGEYPQLTGSAVELAVASLSDVTFVNAG